MNRTFFLQMLLSLTILAASRSDLSRDTKEAAPLTPSAAAKESVIVEYSSCGDLSKGSDLASARHSFCGDYDSSPSLERNPNSSASAVRIDVEPALGMQR